MRVPPPPPDVAAPPAAYAQLLEKVDHVEDSLEENLPPGGPSTDTAQRRVDWQRQVENAVLEVSASFPEGMGDYDVRKLLEFTVELGQLVAADEAASDPEGKVELATMRAADVARRIQRRLLRQHLDDPRVALEFIFGVLANVSISEVARLLGTSTKTAGAWKQGSPIRQTAKRRRAILVAQLLTYLRSSMTPHGLIMWFDSERAQLGGRTPLQVLDDDSNAWELLMALARGSRGQLAD